MTAYAGRLQVEVYPTRADLGRAAAAQIAAALRELLRTHGRAGMIFGSAPSQNEVLDALAATPEIDWNRVTAFHLDEYAGASEEAPYSFRRYLLERLFSRITVAAFHGIRGDVGDLAEECARYAGLLEASPTDIALLGIGENGHLAFNDPPCDFDDPALVRVVHLAASCRLQQVHDGAFASLDDVPQRAITLTVPAIFRVPCLFAIVPGAAKAPTVRSALKGPVTPLFPASILRNHAHALLFLDRDSASLLSWGS